MSGSSFSLSEAVSLFENAIFGEVADSTLAWYRNRLARLVEELGADTAVSSLSVDDVRRYRRGLLEQTVRWENHEFRPSANHGLSPHTIDGHLRAIKRFFRFLVEEGRLDVSPAERVKRPKLPDDPPKEISRADFQALVSAAVSPRDRVIVLFLGFTGCRLDGLASLTLADLDVEGGAAVVHEKGDKSRYVYFGPSCQAALRDYLETRPAVDHDYLLCSARLPFGRLTRNGVYQAIGRLAERAGVSGRWNPHSFRHAAALNWLREGMDIGTVSQLLGHEGPEITIKSYGRFQQSELRKRHSEFTWIDDSTSSSQDEETGPA